MNRRFCEFALAPDRHVVSWKAPARPKRVVTHGANLVAETPTKARSLWQRMPSWGTKFDPKATDLVALFISTQAPTDELVFRNFRFARAK